MNKCNFCSSIVQLQLFPKSTPSFLLQFQNDLANQPKKFLRNLFPLRNIRYTFPISYSGNISCAFVDYILLFGSRPWRSLSSVVDVNISIFDVSFVKYRTRSILYIGYNIGILCSQIHEVNVTREDFRFFLIFSLAFYLQVSQSLSFKV